MWSTVGGIVQVLTIVVTATFGVLGTLSKREPGVPLKRSDKITLASIVVASLLALTAFAVDRVKKLHDRDVELRRVAVEVERQGKLLMEVQRGQHAIQEFGVEVNYTIPANHPALANIMANWKDYIARAKPSDFDEFGYSKDGKAFVSRDLNGNITSLAIHDKSELFPQRGSGARELLLPELALQFFRQGTPIDPMVIGAIRPYARKGKNLDLSLYVPLSVVNRTSKPQDGDPGRKINMSVRLWYHIAKSTIEVSGSDMSATALADTGAIVSLLDLPGRPIVLTGLPAADVADIKSIKITATTRAGRFWSGHKEIRGKSLLTQQAGKYKIASYTLKAEDFRGLTALASVVDGRGTPEADTRAGGKQDAAAFK